MKIIRVNIPLIILFWDPVCSVPGTVAFQATSPSPLRASQNHHVSTARLLSLDDNWEEIANQIGVAASQKSVELSTYAKKISTDLQWKQVFSPEWFAAVGDAFSDLGALYLALPLWVEVATVVLPVLFRKSQLRRIESARRKKTIGMAWNRTNAEITIPSPLRPTTQNTSSLCSNGYCSY